MQLTLAMAADPPTEAREPGAPVPKDEIDPELVSLRPRTQVGLLTSFSVVVFCIYLAAVPWIGFALSTLVFGQICLWFSGLRGPLWMLWNLVFTVVLVLSLRLVPTLPRCSLPNRG